MHDLHKDNICYRYNIKVDCCDLQMIGVHDFPTCFQGDPGVPGSAGSKGGIGEPGLKGSAGEHVRIKFEPCF